MNKKFKKLFSTVISMIMTLVLLMTSVEAKQNTLMRNDLKDKEIVTQINQKFPEDDLTSRVYAQCRRNFKAYKNRGYIEIENSNVESAEVYINGYKVPIEKVLKEPNHRHTLDISKYTVDGTNTIKVLNIKPNKGFLNIYIPYPTLKNGKPEDVGFSSEKLQKVDKLINDDIKNGFPGAVLMIIKDGKIVKNKSYGYKQIYDGNKLIKNPEAMTKETMFDLASNTKMFATNLALQQLVSEGKLNVNDLVSKYIAGFKGEGRENIRVENLLTHSAGFASSIHFHEPDNEVGPEFYSVDREKTLKLLEKAPLVYKTGTKSLYSDTDYMILGYIIEKITGQTQDKYVEENIYKPLGLTHTLYNPLRKKFSKEQFAATERNGNTRDFSRDFPNIRKNTLRGEVHDEKAYYSMDGISGHAGLFSSTSDLAVLAQLILNNGGYGNYKLCNQDVIEQFCKPSDTGNNRGLGWDRASNGGLVWEFGPYSSNQTIGHTGWTGTLSLIDPKYDMAIILLTNKKNTPCPDGKFEGDKFETGKYGSVISLIYESLLEKGNNIN